MAATIGIMLGGAIANALAFTGGNFLFSLLGKQQADEERIRHDKAIEQLQSAQAEYSKKRQERLDYLNARIRAETHSEQTYQNVDEALELYYQVTGGDKSSVPEIGIEPKMEEYYQPSEEQQQYELLFMAGGLVLTGITAFKII